MTSMVLNTQDRALLRDLKLPPLWLCVAYVAVGMVIAAAGLFGDTGADRWLCLAGGVLIALGAEKWLSRRTRGAALKLIRAHGPLRARVTRRDWTPGHSAQRQD